MSRQNPFCGCSLMHWTRRTLSNIGTVQVWSTLSEQLCACCISTHAASVLWYTEIQRHAMYFRVKLCPLVFWTVPTLIFLEVIILIFNYNFLKRFIPYTKSVVQFSRIFVGTLRFFKIICLIK